MDQLAHIINGPKEKTLRNLKSFSFQAFVNYIGTQGTSKIMSQGFKYSLEGYIKNVKTSVCSNGSTAVQAECYASMKKSELRSMYMVTNGDQIFDSYCECKAG
jgi:thiamine pyrophosphokinase